MSKWTDDAETMDKRIYRALVVQEFGPDDTDALDFIARQKGWD